MGPGRPIPEENQGAKSLSEDSFLEGTLSVHHFIAAPHHSTLAYISKLFSFMIAQLIIPKLLFLLAISIEYIRDV
jgi:hypothetical protein